MEKSFQLDLSGRGWAWQSFCSRMEGTVFPVSVRQTTMIFYQGEKDPHYQIGLPSKLVVFLLGGGSSEPRKSQGGKGPWRKKCGGAFPPSDTGMKTYSHQGRINSSTQFGVNSSTKNTFLVPE